MTYSPTVTYGAVTPKVGGPKQVTGYFTADTTTTEASIDLSAYGLTGIKFAVATGIDDVASSPAVLRAVTFTTTSTTLQIDHTAPTATTLVISFIADIY